MSGKRIDVVKERERERNEEETIRSEEIKARR